MSFSCWLKKYRDSVVRSMPWIEEYMQDAFKAGQAYEKQLAKARTLRKQKKESAE